VLLMVFGWVFCCSVNWVGLLLLANTIFFFFFFQLFLFFFVGFLVFLTPETVATPFVSRFVRIVS